MIETCIHNHGVGLAAPQVAEEHRMFVMRAEPDSDTDLSFTTILNPRFLAMSDPYDDTEGCLSLPGFAGKVERCRSILVSYQKLDGTTCERSLDGLAARVFQHEADHLSGILYPMRAKQMFRVPISHVE